MAKRNQEPERGSELPESLIPHLIPSTRTNLDTSSSSISAQPAEDLSRSELRQRRPSAHPPLPSLPPINAEPPFHNTRTSQPYVNYDLESHEMYRGNVPGIDTPSRIENRDRTSLHPAIHSLSDPPYPPPDFRPHLPRPSMSIIRPILLPERDRFSHWGQDESGPSSQSRYARWDQAEHHRHRGSSQPPRLDYPCAVFSGLTVESERRFPGEFSRQARDRNSTIESGLIPPQHERLHNPGTYPHFQTSRITFPEPRAATAPAGGFIRSSHSPVSGIGALSIETYSSDQSRETRLVEGRSMGETSSAAASTSTSGDDLKGKTTQVRKKRRTELDETDESTSVKAGNPKKVPLACEFCRARKIRCSGEKPTCDRCKVRGTECVYSPVIRRRGPGKAPKGSRSKAGNTATRVSESALETRESGSNTDINAQVPETRGSSSVMSVQGIIHRQERQPSYGGVRFEEGMMEERPETPPYGESSSETDSSGPEETPRGRG